MDTLCRFYLRAFQTRKAFARMGVVSSLSSDTDETNGPPASSEVHVCLMRATDAEQALRSDEVPMYESNLPEKSAAELNSVFAQGKNRSCKRTDSACVCDETIESLVDQTVNVEPQLRQYYWCS